MSFSGKWVKLGITTLIQANQTQKDKHYIFSLIYGSLILYIYTNNMCICAEIRSEIF